MTVQILKSSAPQLQTQLTRDQVSGLHNLEVVEAIKYGAGDDGAKILLAASAKKPILVTEIGHLVVTALDGTVDIGDGTTSNKFIATAAITEATVGNRAVSALGALATAPFTVQVTLTTVTAGAGILWVKYIPLAA